MLRRGCNPGAARPRRDAPDAARDLTGPWRAGYTPRARDPTVTEEILRMRPIAAALVLVLACAVPGWCGWTVNARGECVEAWVPPAEGQGWIAMVNAPALPFREAVGGGQMAADGGGTQGVSVATVLTWPALILGGFGAGVIEMPLWFVLGLVDGVTLGHFDTLPNDAKPLTLTTIRPRFLSGVPDDAAKKCAAQH
jgi:hypothetical protein